uniref:VWFA domain-containing protein n=1 Tax=Cyprinus carpio carpio TaxID=630221 RepID=A0A9J8C0M8_CYPCA
MIFTFFFIYIFFLECDDLKVLWAKFVKRDVAFLIDGSDDSKIGFEGIRNFIQRIVESLNVEEDLDRVAVVQYSRDPTANFYLSSYSTKKEVLNSIRSMRHKSGRPLNTGAALLFIKENIFTQSSGSRRHEGVPQILYLFSGGRSGDDVRTISQSLRENNIKVITIGTSNSDTLELQTMSTIPAYAFSVPDFTSINSIVQKVASILTSGDEIPEQFPTPGGTGFKRDIAFLVDGSDSTRRGFPEIRDFLYNIITNLSVGVNNDRISIIQYSNVAVTNFYLNSFLRKEDVLNAVKVLSHKGGRPLNTGSSLQYVKENIFISASGSRHKEGIPQILILLTSGKSRDSISEAASALKKSGYVLSFLISLFNICFIAQSERQRKDVVFLLDGSDGTRNGFPAMKEFVQRMVERLDIAENRDRISVVQYSREAEVHFYLNTHTTKEDILDGVRGLKHKGGRPLYTGAGLQYVRDNVFTASSGSRRLEGVPQILVFLSGGRSSDSVDAAASSLKELGVLTFGIGSKGSDSRELQRISYDPNYRQCLYCLFRQQAAGGGAADTDPA